MEWNAARAADLFRGRCVWIKGDFQTWTRDALFKRLSAAGARCVRSHDVSRPELVLSGMGWDEGIRTAIGRGLEVWTEGELLLHLEGREAFPLPEDIPCAEHLRQLPVLEAGVTPLSAPPGHTGALLLHWEKVAFSPHLRFLELFGFELAGPHQWRGHLSYDGVPLKPAEGSVHSFCAERLVRSPAWESGSEIKALRQELQYSGADGFNCTPLIQSRGTLARPWAAAWPSGWKVSNHRGPRVFGALTSHTFVEDYWVDLDAGRWKVSYFTAESFIKPSEPFYI